MNLSEDDKLQRSIDSLAAHFDKYEPRVHAFRHQKPAQQPYEAQRRDFTPVKVKHQRVRRSLGKALAAWTLLK